MRNIQLFVGLISFLCLLPACHDIPLEPTDGGPSSMFDPETATVPLPNNILVDQATGLLTLPSQDCTKLPEGLDKLQCPLTNEVTANLGLLDGWPTGMGFTIPFDSKLDQAKIADNVKVVDVTNPAAPVLLAASTYYAFFNKSISPATSKPFLLYVKNKMNEACKDQILCMPWEYKKGSRWIAIAGTGLTDESGVPVLENPAFYLMAAPEMLVDAKGNPLVSIWDPNNEADRETAQMMEGFRSRQADTWNGLEASGIATRANTVAFAWFGVQSGPTPIFNPLTFGQELPGPIDWNGKSAKAALDAKPTTNLDLPLDAASLTEGAIRFVKKTATGFDAAVQFTASATTTPDSKGRYQLVIAPSAALDKKTTYAVVVTNSVKGVNGTPAQQDQYFMIAKFKNPLVVTYGGKKYPGSTFLDSSLELLIGALKKNPITATTKDWNDSYYDPLMGLIPNLESLEAYRTAYQPVFAISDALGIPQNKVVSLWTFTTTD